MRRVVLLDIRIHIRRLRIGERRIRVPVLPNQLRRLILRVLVYLLLLSDIHILECRPQ
jgi:hypothetical protein